MNLWIDIARDSLVQTIAGVDCLILNDAELRQLTEKPNLVSAAREVLAWGPPGPSVIIAKQGEYGAALITADGFFSLPAFPLENVVDPTGAGDTFAGGFVGYIAAHAGDGADGRVAAAPGDGLRHRARLVQRRGVRHRARRAADRRGDRRARRASSRAITHFSDDPVALRGCSRRGGRRSADRGHGAVHRSPTRVAAGSTISAAA